MLKILITGLLAVLSGITMGQHDIYTGWFSNKALKGYDAVAYFTRNKAVKGNTYHKVKFLGVVWYFSSSTHLQMFQKNPRQYSPKYGGYSAWSVATHKTRVASDPEYWSIQQGKLYLHASKQVQEQWANHSPDIISKGDSNWLKMQDDDSSPSGASPSSP